MLAYIKTLLVSHAHSYATKFKFKNFMSKLKVKLIHINLKKTTIMTNDPQHYTTRVALYNQSSKTQFNEIHYKVYLYVKFIRK